MLFNDIVLLLMSVAHRATEDIFTHECCAVMGVRSTVTLV